jgi:hypothetical protein
MIIERPYKDEPTTGVKFFVSTEVEKTPAYGLKTLFVVGLQDQSTVLNLIKEHEVEHVFLGANQSFFPDNVDDLSEWEIFLGSVLKSGVMVTLDFDIVFIAEVYGFNFINHFNFIPLISIKIPYVDKLNYNACIKIDDVGFESTNFGVWVHHVQDLMDSKTYTPWSEYKNDKIIKGEVDE